MAEQDAKLEKVSYAKERELNSPNAIKQSREARSKKGLKVEIKLASAFVKKVSTVTDETVSSLIRDINEKLNLTRFVEEVVASLAKAPLKLKDVEAATALCSAMHRSYDEFTDPLVRSLIEQYDQACRSDDKADVARRRVLLRWLSELYMVGLADGDPQLILKIVRAATRAGSPPGPLPDPLPETFPPLPDQGCMNLQAVTVLLKAMGEDLIGPSSEYPPPSIRTKLLALFTAFALGALVRLKEERSALRRVKRRAENESLKRGEISEEASEALSKREKICDDLYQSCIVLCETLSLPKPPSPEELREEEEAKREAADQAIAEKVGLELLNRRKGGEADLSFEAWIFGDEATRAFYENLDDIVAVIPRAILEKPDQALQPSVIERLKASKDSALVAPLETAEQQSAEGSDAVKPEDTDAIGGGSDEIDNPDAIQVDDDEDDNAGISSLKVESVNRPVEELMSKLPDMLTERLVENFARDFAHHNSKSARKRLVQELFNVPRGRTELLPYYARLVAILSKVYVGIGSTLVDSIRGAFFRCTRDHRAGSRLNSRLRYTKYLGELVKFGLKCPELECPPAAAFRALKQTMDFFQGENIDMACALVESCGRELYRTPRTHPEMARLLESLQRIRTARNLSPVHDALVDNAYYHCIPVDQNAALASVKQARRERSEIEKYVRYLLISQLGSDIVAHTDQEQQKSRAVVDAEVDKKQSAATKLPKKSTVATLTPQETSTVASLLRLPWNTNYEECEDAVSRAVIASCKHRAGTLPMVCHVLVMATKRYPRLSVRVVEDLIETIVWGLDENDFRHNQRRIGQIKCLAYMLRVNLITPALYFDVLFMVLHRGHEKPASMLAQMGPIGSSGALESIRSCAFGQTYRYHPAVPCVNDPPWDTFRIRLVCASLETAAERLLGASVLPRLEVFVMYLERYVWNKSYVPIEVEFQMLDVLQDLERRLPAPTKGTKGGRGRSSRRGGKHKVEASKVKLVGIAPTRQAAEDMIAAIEGKGFQSELKVSDVIEEGDEEDEEDDEVDDEEEEEEDFDDDDEEDEDDEEEETVEDMKQPPPPIARPKLPPPEPTPEDLAFEQEFAKLMKETLEQSGKSNLGGQALRGDNLVIPLGVMKKTAAVNNRNVTSTTGTGNGGDQTSAAGTSGMIAGGGGVALSLLKRGPNKKIEVKALVVPEDSALAKASQMREDTIKEMREEEEAIKRLTLKAAAATTTRLREAGDF